MDVDDPGDIQDILLSQLETMVSCASSCAPSVARIEANCAKAALLHL